VPLAFHSGREADHSPNTPSWRGAQLGGAQGQPMLSKP